MLTEQAGEYLPVVGNVTGATGKNLVGRGGKRNELWVAHPIGCQASDYPRPRRVEDVIENRHAFIRKNNLGKLNVIGDAFRRVTAINRHEADRPDGLENILPSDVKAGSFQYKDVGRIDSDRSGVQIEPHPAALA